MKSKNGLSLVLAGLVSLWAPVAPAESQNQAAPTVPLPQSGIPQIFTFTDLEDRAAAWDQFEVT